MLALIVFNLLGLVALVFMAGLGVQPCCCDVECPTCILCNEESEDFPASFDIAIAGLVDGTCATCDEDDGTYNNAHAGFPACSYPGPLPGGSCIGRVRSLFLGELQSKMIRVEYEKPRISFGVETLYLATFEKVYSDCIDCAGLDDEEIPLVSQTGAPCSTAATPTCHITSIP